MSKIDSRLSLLYQDERGRTGKTDIFASRVLGELRCTSLKTLVV